MLKTSKESSTGMGASEKRFVVLLEAPSSKPTILLEQHHHQPQKQQEDSPKFQKGKSKSKINFIRSGSSENIRCSVNDNNNNDRNPKGSSCKKIDQQQETFQQKAKKFLTLSPGGYSLKPSASTSCLFSDSSDSSSTASGHSIGHQNNDHSLISSAQNSTTTLDANLSRASLTHEWKKVKTLNRCRECNLPVYFNGRECSFCGFVAHKKCLTILVIKCSGQQVVGNLSSSSSDYFLKYFSSNQQQQQQQPEHSQQLNNNNASQQQNISSPSSSSSIRRPIFGQPVDVDGNQIIDFIRRFVNEIDSRGLTSKGIYRVSSIKSKVDRLCTYYDQNLSSLVDLSSFHPNIIANALKMYLRQLPEPLLTNELYGQFIQIAKRYSNSQTNPSVRHNQSSRRHNYQQDQNANYHRQQRKSIGSVDFAALRQKQQLQLSSSSSSTSNANQTPEPYNPMMIVEFKELMDSLPPINRELTAIIMRHLRRVADMSEENQMSAKNLSIIFGPTLLSADNKSLAIVDNIHQARVVELMITWADQIFPQYTNYESKAMIELQVPENRSVCEIPHPSIQRCEVLDSPDAQSQSSKLVHFSLGPEDENDEGERQETILITSPSLQAAQQVGTKTPTSSTNDRRNTTEKQAVRLENSEIDERVKLSPQQQKQQPLVDSRDELKELRRKFFTDTCERPKQTQQQSKESPSHQRSSPKGGLEGRGDKLSPAPTRVNDPQSSVPVIKVQPFFCDTLRK